MENLMRVTIVIRQGKDGNHEYDLHRLIWRILHPVHET